MADTSTDKPADTKPADKPAFAKFQDDVKTDVKSLIDEARQSAKDGVDAAASAVDKLLLHAAGDVKPLFDELEQAAIPFVLSKIPGPFAGVVGGFVQAALGSAQPAANAVVDKTVAVGLAYAEAAIASVVHHLDVLLGA